MWNSVFIVVFWFYTILRLFYSWRTSSEACVYPRHPSGFGCGRGVPRLPGFTLYSSDNPLRSRVLPEVYRGCNQDVGAKPSLPSLSRLYQSGCVGRGPPWRWGYGWSRWIWRMALKFKGNDSWWLTSSIANRISLFSWKNLCHVRFIFLVDYGQNFAISSRLFEIQLSLNLSFDLKILFLIR